MKRTIRISFPFNFWLLCIGFFNTGVNGIEASPEVIKIVAAENFYGDVARMIGGDKVEVISVIKAGNSDPHLFTLGASSVQKIQNADLVIANGAGYDPWMDHVLSSYKKSDLRFIKVSEMLPYIEQNNPHIWYHPDALLKLAAKLTNALIDLSPQDADFFASNYQEFVLHWLDFFNLAQIIKKESAADFNLKCIANEEVFNHMLDFLDLEIVGGDLSHIYSNSSEPSGQRLSEFFYQLRNEDIALIFLNSQVRNSITKFLLDYGKIHICSVVEVTETMPENQVNSIEWLYNTLLSLRKDIEIQKYLRYLLNRAKKLEHYYESTNSNLLARENDKLLEELKEYQAKNPKFNLSALIGIYDNQLQLQDLLLKENESEIDRAYIESFSKKIMPLLANLILSEIRDKIVLSSDLYDSHVLENTLWKILTAGLLATAQQLDKQLIAGGVRTQAFLAIRKSLRIALLIIPETVLTIKPQLLRILFSEKQYELRN